MGVVKFYTREGNVYSEVSYLNNRFDGPWIEYYDNGQVKAYTDYKDNLMHGSLRAYAEDGTLVSEGSVTEGSFTEGNGFIKHTDNGILVQINYYTKEKLTKSEGYRSDGTLRNERFSTDGKTFERGICYKTDGSVIELDKQILKTINVNKKMIMS